MKDGGTEHLTAPVDAGVAHAASSATVDLPDRWRLLELLGSGGQATVWLAEDRTLGQRVALKILPTDADDRTRARWLEEVRQGRRLSHPNLIRIFDVVETSDRPVAIMEYVPGGTLADRVVADGAQPVEDVIRWGGEVLSVLAYLHDNRIVHRDVKPSNLLVAKDGTIKLSDLGLVRHMDRSSDLTRTLEGVGTPRFMAPEQLRGEAPTASCDLYSLGVTLFQLLTGRLPFEGDSAFQVADGHLHADPPPIRGLRPDCPRWLARYVERLLEKQPNARFGSADQALAALDRRRVGFTRRALRRIAVAVLVGAAGWAGWYGITIVTRSGLNRVDIEGDGVVARDAADRRLWSAERPGFAPNAVVADFIGDSRPEAAISWSPTGADDPEAGVILELRASDGEVIRTVDNARIGESEFPGYAPVWFLHVLAAGDMLGDGPDLVWGLVNPRWFPGLIGATSFRSTADRPLMLLANSGHVQNLTVADLDHDGRDEIVAIMVNNRMGYQKILVILSSRSRITGESCGQMNSPDITAFLPGRSPTPEGCLSYTPLGSDLLVVEPPRATARGIELVLDGEIRIFDAWGNPEGSPLFGLDGSPREAFWSEFASSCARLRLAPVVDPPFSLDDLRADHPEVLSESAMDVAATLVGARALAWGGHGENAVALLREGVARNPDERDLHLRLGELLLIDNQRAEGREWVTASVNVGRNGRNRTDLTLMLTLDAALHGDRRAYDETRRFIGNLGMDDDIVEMSFLDVAWLFFQGQWSDPRLGMIDPGWVHQWVALIQGWARFEATLAPEPALAAVAEFQMFSETRDLARLLEARVLLAAGEVTTAAQLAEGALNNLEMDCRVSFEACAWVPLAEWVLGQALSSTAGREDEAQAVLARAAEHASGTWIATSLTQ